MKKIIILISTIIVLFTIYIYVFNAPRDYQKTYTINELTVNEQYNKDKGIYLFIIKDKDTEIPYQILHKYIKKRKLVNKISKEDNCYTITVFEENYKLCSNETEITTSKETIKKEIESDKHNINVYSNSEIIYIWNYKGYYKLENNKLTTIDLFENDNYENKISVANNNYLITANYDEKYEFNNFFIINKANNKVKELKLENPVSSSSYFLGTYEDKIYLLDPKYKVEYEIIPSKNKITTISKDGEGYYYDNEKINISINKLIKEKLIFTQNNTYNYFLENNKLLLKINGTNINIATDNVGEIIKIDNDKVYYLSNGTLFKYTFGKQNEIMLENSEWKFNTTNQIYIFN